VRRIASGVRSSWLASETNERSRASTACRRPSIALSVLPRRAISSRDGGTGSRPSASPVSSAARRRIRSTGRNAAAATA
jgi:hypothetical protein